MFMEFSRGELILLVKALDSYIRRKVRDYNHADRNGASDEQLQRQQARIEAAEELREIILEEVER